MLLMLQQILLHCVCVHQVLSQLTLHQLVVHDALTPFPCSHFLNCAYAATLVRSSSLTHRTSSLGPSRRNMYWDLHTISSFLLKSKIPLWAGCSGFPSQSAGIHLAGTQWQKRSCQSHTQNFSLLESQMLLWVPLPGFTLPNPCKSPYLSPSELPPTDFTCWERSLAPCK